MFVYISLLIILCAIFFYYRYLRLQINNSIPTIPNTLSILKVGFFNIDMKEVFKQITYMGEWTNNNGGVSKVIFGPVVIYVISSPEDLTTVLTRCMDKMFLYDLIKPYVGAELVAASVPMWKRNRKLVDFGFKTHILENYLDLFNYQAVRLCQAMAKFVNKETDFRQIITRNVLETVSRTTMGMNIDGEDLITDNYSKAVDTVMDSIINRVKYPWLLSDFIYKFSSVKKEQDEALKIIWSLSDQMVKLKKEEIRNKLKNMDANLGKDKTFETCLESMIENIITEENETLSNFQLRCLVDNLMLAGFDTTSSAILFILVCIGSYPDVQRKLYDEILNVIGTEKRPIRKEDLLKLYYLEAVVKETIRLYPAGIVVARSTRSEVKLQNCTIPAGCHVVGHIWAVNRNTVYWGPDANYFKPERWLDNTVPKHSAAFASFPPGRRNCLGKLYGMMLMKITIAHLVRNFYITADDKKLEFEFVILLKSVAGHLMKLESRKNEQPQ